MLIFRILLLFLSVVLHAETIIDNGLNKKELFYSCIEEDYISCKALVKDGLPSVDECSEKSSCIVIAHIYNIVKQYDKAILYLQKSCDKDIIQACFELAYNYELLQQYTKARSIYEDSCNHGFMASCYNLAMLYVNGYGVKIDNQKANRIFFEACSNDEYQSCYNLAISYKNGYGFKADRLKAKKFFKKACDLGMKDGCVEYKIIESADFSITTTQHLEDNDEEYKLRNKDINEN